MCRPKMLELRCKMYNIHIISCFERRWADLRSRWVNGEQRKGLNMSAGRLGKKRLMLHVDNDRFWKIIINNNFKVDHVCWKAENRTLIKKLSLLSSTMINKGLSAWRINYHSEDKKLVNGHLWRGFLARLSWRRHYIDRGAKCRTKKFVFSSKFQHAIWTGLICTILLAEDTRYTEWWIKAKEELSWDTFERV